MLRIELAGNPFDVQPLAEAERGGRGVGIYTGRIFCETTATRRVRGRTGGGKEMDCHRARTKEPGEWLDTCPDFSAPLAEQLTEWILNWEPDLTESIKWNNLCFSGRKLVVGLSACRRHLALFFFRGTELPDPAGLFSPGGVNNTNIRSLRLTTLDGVNRAALRALLRAAVALDGEASLPPLPKKKRRPWPVPDFFSKALKRNRAAAEAFCALAPSCQREYLVWLSTAKRPETRARRLAETLRAITAGRKWAQRKMSQSRTLKESPNLPPTPVRKNSGSV